MFVIVVSNMKRMCVDKETYEENKQNTTNENPVRMIFSGHLQNELNFIPTYNPTTIR